MNKTILTIAMNPSLDKTITINKLIPYGLNRVKTSRLDPGGKGINVAKVLNNFGVNVLVSGLIAGDNGRLLINFLNKQQIKNNFLEVEGDTRINLKVFDESVNKMTEINESGFLVNEKIKNTFIKKFIDLLDNIEIMVLSGSLPLGIESNFYAEIIKIAKEKNIKTILDADGETLQKGIEAVPYAIKPNIDELQKLIGRKCEKLKDVVDATGELISKGIEIVIVSMGADGAIVADKNEVYKADSWNIKVNSTVGAGDSMVGSLAYSLQQHYSLIEIARITTASGTITASKAGTDICTKDEVLNSLENVNITKIK